MFPRVGYPLFQLVSGCHRSGGIVRIAEIDQVHLFPRQFRGKIVFCSTRQVDQPLILTTLVSLSGVSHHYVGIHIHRIHRIRDSDPLSNPKDIEDVATITL